MLALAAALSAQGGPQMATLHVNATTGDDSGPGSYAQPYKTLNKALDVAYITRFPNGPGQGPFGMVEIKVYRSATPIAPKGFGGEEEFGWTTPDEDLAGVTHEAFPLRMVPGVDVIGVSRGGVKPVIQGDENAQGTPQQFVEWEPGLPKTYVWMASNVTLRGFRVTGAQHILSRVDDKVSAVRARDVVNATIPATSSTCTTVSFSRRASASRKAPGSKASSPVP